MNQDNHNITLAFTAAPILKCIYAQCALHAMQYHGSKLPPTIISDDNEILLKILLANAYFNIIGALCAYIENFDSEKIDNGDLTLTIAIPHTLESDINAGKILYKKIETILINYILCEVYRTDNGYSELADQYADKLKTETMSLISQYAI